MIHELKSSLRGPVALIISDSRLPCVVAVKTVTVNRLLWGMNHENRYCSELTFSGNFRSRKDNEDPCLTIVSGATNRPQHGFS